VPSSEPSTGAQVAERPKGTKIVVVMPARQAARTLERTVSGIPRDWVDEIILVDDSSTDATVELARALPIGWVWY
jgi:glycosyltransferase involved in cell wall biosynthesis